MEKENMFPDGMRQNTDLSCSFFHPSWESSMDQSDPFESALSSMVSSPTASNNANANGESFVVRELIGRLGSICNSGEISPHQPFSAYSTPLSSPPKLHLENQHVRGNLQFSVPSLTSMAPFSTDPGFVERAARYSCFANSTLNEMGPKLDSGNRRLNISGSKPKAVQESRGGALGDHVEFGDSRENSSVSEQIPPAGETGLNSRKRKSIPKGKGKETTLPAKDANENAESDAKRSKSEDGCSGKPSKDNSNQKQSEDNSKLSEPPKDYIHVRARRGQATDAHSLAERVRREKISERMKFLQDLVPGCNKVTGKAVMLDEIINYVQSLQQQVEFLSMKLATINPRMDFDMEAAVMSKDLFQSRGSLPHNVGYPFQPQPNLHTVIPSGIQAPFPASNGLGRNHTLQLPPVDTTSHVSTFWEEDLHSFVQMGFGQNQTQNCPGILPTSQMKVEL